MKNITIALRACLLFTLLLGGLYPALVTGLSQLLFPWQANGSIISAENGRAVGSALIGQPFTTATYFWSRPSATGEHGYNPLASGGSNLGPTNPALLALVTERSQEFRQHNSSDQPIPSDLVLASASGLDPHITPAAARAQLPRVAKARGLSEQKVAELVAQHTEERQWGILGEPRINVLQLNLALDNVKHE